MNIRLAFAATLLLAVALQIPAVNPPPRPNIVFIIADDLGWADVGFNGAKFYETPHIDRLRSEGMNFTAAYPGAANCMPSRSCIMTGMYTPRTQMWTPGRLAKGNPDFMKFLVPARGMKGGTDAFPSLGELPPSVTAIPEVLKSAGYRSARFGKWHLGPNTQGFDISDSNGRGAGAGGSYYGNINVAEWLTDAAVSFISDSQELPFFLYLAHWDVHTPIRARPDVVAKYERKLKSGSWDRKWNPTYAAMIEAVDQSVGRIRTALDEHDVAKNTLFVFTSDNGGHSGATWCEPLKGAKGAFYEGGIRVPTCVRWPAVVRPGSTCDVPITGVDFLPTFAELAGAPLPDHQPVDGQSFTPLLRGEKAPTDRAIFWHYPLYLAGGDYNQVLPVHGTDTMYWRATPCSVVRQGDWKLVQLFESNTVELYNLRNDLGEQTDVSSANPTKTAELLGRLQRWQRDTKATIPSQLNPGFNPKAATAKTKSGKGKKK